MLPWPRSNAVLPWTAEPSITFQKENNMNHRRYCTCSHTPVNVRTVNPPDLILDPDCPVHGEEADERDPDEERERKRDDTEWDRACG
jgi:hypothetical protein